LQTSNSCFALTAYRDAADHLPVSSCIWLVYETGCSRAATLRHCGVWGGMVLLVIGGFYVVRFRPRGQGDKQARGLQLIAAKAFYGTAILFLSGAVELSRSMCGIFRNRSMAGYERPVMSGEGQRHFSGRME
jgi:hypothetical protein